MMLYPHLEAVVSAAEPSTLVHEQPSPQTFRLHKIGELEAFLRAEIDSRSHLHKKYRRLVNAFDSVCAGLATLSLGMGIGGAALLATGVGVLPGLVLEGATALAGLLDIAGVGVSRRCSAKAAKHEAIRVLASAKLNTVHNHISKALEDSTISDDEYKLILDELEKYRVMKDEVRRKQHANAAGSVLNEETKNELIRLGREQARQSFMKRLAAASSVSP